MTVDYGAAVSRAWKYSASTKRIAAFLGLMLIAMVFVIAPLFVIYNSVAAMAGLLNVFALISSFVYLFLGVIMAILIMLYATLLFTHNYANQKSLSASAGAAKSAYLRFLAASIITGAITMFVFLVPFAGLILAIIVSLMFFFLPQEIAVSNSGLSGALSNSYGLFRKKWVDTIITLIVSGVFGILVMLIFAVPFMAAVFFTIGTAVSAGFVTAIMQNLVVLAATWLIALAGVSFAMLFSNGIRTDAYMQMKRRK